MSLSNYSENLLLNWLLTDDTAGTRPTAWYVQLHMTDPTDTGTGGTQPTIISNDYDRQSLGATGFSTSTTGTNSNNAAVSWTANGGAATYVFTYVSIWDAVTAGNCLFVGALAVSETVAAGGVITFAIGKLVASLD
jgi:hypothetical protein